MTLAPTATGGIDLPGARDRVEAILTQFLDRKQDDAAAHKLPTEIPVALRDFLSAGGKRLRPVLCVLGWHAAGGTTPVPASALQVAAALEMFHAFCLVHDDVMDNSTTRRGKPSVHRIFADRHGQHRSRQAADRFGTSAAILVGDFALAWSDELIHTAGLTPAQLARLLPVLDAMRSEVLYGQYLDVAAGGQFTDDVERAQAIIRYKTAKYTCERPLHIGAVLAGSSRLLLDSLSAYALPLGEAFQLRDDLLGVFGDPEVTGKSRLDDLREGKHTVLIALTLQHASRAQGDQLRPLLGCPALTEEQADVARHIITAAHAPDRVKAIIRERYGQALAALEAAPLPTAAREQLSSLAGRTVWRTT
ncbi:polyprenyl synthetase family protein [Streptomyces noursei]|uniref:polyprenyl synthetase family protein n=1 Tax=Streptomyces noursei TaxID=1971 RepID=UPI00340616E5